MKVIVLAVACLMALAGSALADTADDVAAWYRDYAKLWEKADHVDLDAVARYYAIPSYMVDLDGVVQLMSTADAFRANMAASIDSSKQQGWTGGKLISVKAHMLNPGAAFVEAEWANYGLNGTPLVACQEEPETYIAVKTTNGWRFISVHDGPCKALSTGKPSEERVERKGKMAHP
jgi:hypothetical protein